MVHHQDVSPTPAKAGRWFSRILWVGLVVALVAAIHRGTVNEEKWRAAEETAEGLRAKLDQAPSGREGVDGSLHSVSSQAGLASDDVLSQIGLDQVSTRSQAPQLAGTEPTREELVRRLEEVQEEVSARDYEIKSLKAEILRLKATIATLPKPPEEPKPATHIAMEKAWAVWLAEPRRARTVQGVYDALRGLPEIEAFLWLHSMRNRRQAADFLHLVCSFSPPLKYTEDLIIDKVRQSAENRESYEAVFEALQPLRTEMALRAFRELTKDTKVNAVTRAKCLRVLLNANAKLDQGSILPIFSSLPANSEMRLSVLRFMGNAWSKDSAEALAQIVVASLRPGGPDPIRLSFQEVSQAQTSLKQRGRAVIEALRAEVGKASTTTANYGAVEQLRAEVEVMIADIEASLAQKESK